MLDCLGWAIASFYSWLLRDAALSGPPQTSGEISQNTQFAIVISALLILNVVSTLAFVIGTHSIGLPVLAVVQVIDVVATLVLVNLHGTTSFSTSVQLSAGPALTLLLIAVAWRASPGRA